MCTHASRRELLRSALASSSFGFAIGYPRLLFAQSAAPTPQCRAGDEATVRQGEGPYFKPSSPERAELVEPGSKAQLVAINGRVLTRSQIIEAIWDFAYDGGSNVVDQYVNYLRRKIDVPFGRHDIETVRGMGYRLRRTDGG